MVDVLTCNICGNKIPSDADMCWHCRSKEQLIQYRKKKADECNIILAEKRAEKTRIELKERDKIENDRIHKEKGWLDKGFCPKCGIKLDTRELVSYRTKITPISPIWPWSRDKYITEQSVHDTVKQRFCPVCDWSEKISIEIICASCGKSYSSSAYWEVLHSRDIICHECRSRIAESNKRYAEELHNRNERD
jgi:DNA-directed RNA polymerase subunit RPC12/RpoP